MSDRGQSGEGQIKELKVSGHLMALDPGLYVVFNAPGGPKADAAGFPGVRLSAAPGAEHVHVSTFSPDGWIGADSGALVHVRGRRSNLMVTIYQSRDAGSEAPKLQVVLLAPEGAAAPPAGQPAVAAPAAAAIAAPPEPAKNDTVEVVGHIYGRGDVAGRLGDWLGTPGSQRWIEGFGIQPQNGLGNSDIEYQAVLGRGWLSPWSEGGNFCGSRGMSLPILGMRLRLRGEAARTHKLSLTASFVDGTRIGPVGSDEPCEAPSMAALEAFLVTIEKVGGEKVGGEKAGGTGQAETPAKPAPKARAAKPAPAAKRMAAQAAAETPAQPAPKSPAKSPAKSAAMAKPKAAEPAPQPTKRRR